MFSLGQHVFINVYIVYHWALMVPSQVFILPVACTVMHTNACCSLSWWIIFSSILFNFLYLYPFSVGLEPFFLHYLLFFAPAIFNWDFTFTVFNISSFNFMMITIINLQRFFFSITFYSPLYFFHQGPWDYIHFNLYSKPEEAVREHGDRIGGDITSQQSNWQYCSCLLIAKPLRDPNEMLFLSLNYNLQHTRHK